MDVTKVKSAIATVKSEISSLYKGAVTAGEKDPQQLNGLKPLGRANLFLDKAVKAIEAAAESTNGKKEKKPKADKK